MRTFCLSLLALSLAVPARADELYGTLEPFASKAIYFVMTDRFVNGDPSNDHRDQGGRHRTFDLPTPGAPAGQSDNIGYLGGDFKGIVDNAGYIHDMGFGAVWVTPIVDNPDEAFTGGEPVRWGSAMTDRGKTGYHGYWGVNFYKLDEHLPSKGLDFAGFTRAMKGQQLDVVLDIVANHGSPAYSMPKAQPKFGQIFDRDGRKLADHQNLDPSQLDPKHNPIHAFYNTGGGLAQLSDLAEDNPAVLDYLAGAYEQWIEQGAAAFRVDTIGWMPHRFWKQFADRIRARHPGFFMFGEAFDYDAAFIAAHTLERNGHYSVLDFPQRARLSKVFGKEGGGYEDLERTLYLEDGPYANPYDLVTFYDNHDMARLDASDAGFIDANNWLFTARGIPAIYYGSETGFMRGAAEHAGNRNYYGQQRIDAAGDSGIYRNLKRIANLRRESVALQRGLQLNLVLKGDTGAFYRVYEHAGQAQTALVLLNKADTASTIALETLLQAGTWRDGFDGGQVRIDGRVALEVPAHGVRVLFYDGALTNPELRARLTEDMGHRLRD
ncbi:alpha-amylase family glycosyl hydrolase [Pseudoxanthomonas winnipegensis]|uniref:Cyclomaltodextrin glucanotransferase n=1 Tax=Pseudoxanthomonas winnipegensis TaxID=2480810 RepID=A0A4V2HDW7_9GAMM|nr:cyclomaltodextrin glucanotransferase [Pseudoxanthomonas winnipegensis]TAA29583.1 cyclomaltodextrin glucanotransferase [Pseudoxanthomonas winnipegensis]TAA40418.1 cyclomaltodextrin glucanotransferase [Pseudoxanthomonas winnipegensis]TBV76558.1 cyclomaltodextrin glucanotransferase [Pseudoxanthomonas winnipegensis]